MGNYECHITVANRDALAAYEIAEDMGWKTSKIDGDPVLGDKVHYYLTCHGDDYISIIVKMKETSRLLIEAGVKPLREKIEEILYDTKKANDASEAVSDSRN